MAKKDMKEYGKVMKSCMDYLMENVILDIGNNNICTCIIVLC